MLAYPAGFFFIFAAMLILFSSWTGGSAPGTLDFLAGRLLLSGILAASGMLTLTVFTGAFALVTRFWPRRAFRSMAKLVGLVLLGTVIVSALRQLALLPTASTHFAIRQSLNNPEDMLLGAVSGLPLIVIVGEPLLAALLGYWFYLAAVEWSAERA